MRKEKWLRNQMRKDGPSRHITRGITEMVAWRTSIIPEFVKINKLLLAHCAWWRPHSAQRISSTLA